MKNNKSAAKPEEERTALTERKVIHKAVEIAVKNGYNYHDIDKYPWDIYSAGNTMLDTQVTEDWVPKNSLCIHGWDNYYFVWEHVLFQHDFAKAFWGVDPVVKIMEKGIKDGTFELTSTNIRQVAWQYHLQQMVLEENPIDYLRKFVEGGEE